MYGVPVPHVRGDEPAFDRAWLADDDLFPTCVGMNRRQSVCHQCRPPVPHVRGDEPQQQQQAAQGRACSPRAWG